MIRLIFFTLILISPAAFALCPATSGIKCATPMEGTECYSGNKQWIGYPKAGTKDNHDTGATEFLGAIFLAGSNKHILCMYRGNKGSILSMGQQDVQNYKTTQLQGPWKQSDKNYVCNAAIEACKF